MISIVQSDSVVFAEGIGYADIDKQEKVDEHHLFRQGSISKSFTAMALLLALKNSTYDLDTPIKEIDPDIPLTNPWANTQPVRISHLLEHTSGFEDFHLHAMYSHATDSVPPIIDMVNDHSQSLKSRWPPGNRKAYSNPNYIVAGHLVEVLSGQKFDEYVKENLLQKIGMNRSGFYTTKPESFSFSTGYRRSGSILSPTPFARINGSPAGDFCSNAQDMAAYLQFMLRRDSSIFSQTDFDRIEIPQTSIAAHNGLTYGYGLGNYSIWKKGYLFHGHGGQIDGFAARYLYSREADLGIAVAMNRNGNENALLDFVLELIHPNESIAPFKRQIYPIPDSIKTKFSGFYEFNSPKSKLIGFTDKMLAGLTLDFKEDKIITKTILGKPKDTLFYAGNNQFYYNGEGVPSAMLLESESGHSVLWINDNYTEIKSHTRRLIIFFGLLLSFLFTTAFFAYSLVWLIRNVFRKERKDSLSHLLLFGFGLAFVSMFVGFGLSVSHPHTAQQPTFSSLLMYFSSYAMVLLAVGSVLRWRQLEGKKRFMVFYVCSSIAAIIISVYFWNIGFVGLKLWSY